MKQVDVWNRLADLGRVGLLSTSVLIPLRRRQFDRACDTVSALFAAAACSKALKAFVEERRPNGEDYNSFPSHHTAECFAAALSFRKDERSVSVAVALGVAISRVAGRKHYPWDVLAGIAIGAAASALLGQRSEEQAC